MQSLNPLPTPAHVYEDVNEMWVSPESSLSPAHILVVGH
jgi:hypothetical protein